MNLNPKWYEAANEASFKAVAAGYVFQAPNPWMFARPRYYLVNDAQKAEILVRLRRWRLFLVTHAVTLLLIAASATALVMLSPATFVRFQPAFLQLGIATVTVLAVLLLAPILAAPHIYLIRALRPLLADAPRTNERISTSEQLSKIATFVPRWLLIMGLVAGPAMMVGAVLSLVGAFLDEQYLARSLIIYVLMLVTGGLLSAYILHLFRLKAKLSRIAA